MATQPSWARSEVVGYAAALRDRLAAVGAASADLDALVDAAGHLAGLADRPPGVVAQPEWSAAVAEWEKARSRILGLLGRATVGVADIPGLLEFFGDLESIARTGLRAEMRRRSTSLPRR
jgi:hypothetical protein